MKVQQLLLLALVGPFCALTLASPTTLPTDADDVTDSLPAATESIVVTGPPEPVHTAVPNVVAETTLASVAVHTDVNTIAEADTPDALTTEVADALTTEALVDHTTSVGETTVPAMEPAGPTQGAPAEATQAPAGPEEPEEQTKVTEASQTEPEVQIVDEPEQGSLTSGQITGIVIGALVAVVVVIAVVIAVVRRMGKYSP